MVQGIEGKIPHRLLKRLLSSVTKAGREVIVGPAVGEDAFAVGIGETAVVASTDPITFTTEHIGHYAVNVNANDVAAMGARPRWFMATALVPPRTSNRVLAGLFHELDKACVDLGIRLCGGHTETTSAVTRPVVIGAMIGTVLKRRLVRPERARPGDTILLTKRLAIEGTTIIARDKKRVVDRLLGQVRARRARRLLVSPGIGVVREAMCAVDTAPVHAMHDPTEGGFIWGVRELCMATNLGAEIDLDMVPVYKETEKICDHFKINPLGLIASGSLLIAVSRRSTSGVVDAIRKIGIECSEIGRLHRGTVAFMRNGKAVRVPLLKADEISKVV